MHVSSPYELRWLRIQNAALVLLANDTVVDLCELQPYTCQRLLGASPVVMVMLDDENRCREKSVGFRLLK